MKGTVDRKTVQFTPWIFVCCCCFTIRTDTVWINDYATFWCVRKEENDAKLLHSKPFYYSEVCF